MKNEEIRKNHNYEIYKKYNIDTIFEYLENKELPDKVIYGTLDYIDSIERCTIIKNLLDRDGYKCQECDMIPYYFALGKDKINRWHLDLYSDTDHMFTIDHVYPKSKGGENKLENYQLMCKICNEDKSDIVEGEINMKDFHNANYLFKKTSSLYDQIKGVLGKIKDKELICITDMENFTIGKEYQIEDIQLKINENFKTKFKLMVKNDKGDITKTTINNFLTKRDFLSKKKHI
jgi:HNH endonuclease